MYCIEGTADADGGGQCKTTSFDFCVHCMKTKIMPLVGTQIGLSPQVKETQQ